MTPLLSRERRILGAPRLATGADGRVTGALFIGLTK
jgi:hypothetical protein